MTNMRMINTTQRLALASALMAAAMMPAFAATVYVDGTVAGPGTGTDVDPFKTLTAAVAAATAGDTIEVAAGTYNEGAAVTIAKNLTILGPNAGISPNTGTRGAEAIFIAWSHNTSNTDWTFNSNIFRVQGGANVTIDGLTLDGYNPLVSGGGQTGSGGAPVGATTGLYATAAGTLTFTNNIVSNFAQFPLYIANTPGNNLVSNNLFSNAGLPNILGFGSAAIITGTSTYARVIDNVMSGTRGGLQFQSQNTANPGSPAIISGNTMSGLENQGIFLNVMSGTANNFQVLNNTISGQGADKGSGAISVVSQTDGATPRQHVFSGNNISNIFNGFFFANNSTLKQRISGGTISNVSYAAAFANRLGYRGEIAYSGDLVGRDGTGGPAVFDSAVATAALEAGLSAELMLPNALDAADGQAAFANTDFTGKIALLTVQSADDMGVAAQNAAAAGAIGVILIYDKLYTSGSSTGFPEPPIRATSTTVTSVDVPTTTIDQTDGDALKTALGSGSVTATMSKLLYVSNSYGVRAPGVIGGSTEATLVNVQITDTARAGFGVFDIPNGIGTGAAAGPVKGNVIGGSAITNSPVGVLIVGENGSFETTSARFENNGIGVDIQGGELIANSSAFAGNTIAGIRVAGPNATADIRNSDFFGAAQGVDVDLSGNPTGFQVIDSNFDAVGIAIRNNNPLDGDVLATGNWWGDVSGPNSIDGTPYTGTGAQVSDGVNAADILAAAALVADDDGDGLSNSIENSIGTNPAVADTDNDGIEDGVEVAQGWDPLDATSPVDQNTAPDPSLITDSDNDGIADGIEAQIGTNPALRDTDGDGIKDGYEVLRGSDPLNGLDFPPFGDADNSGTVDQIDAVALLEAFLGIRDFSSVNRAEIDVNLDGKLDNVDAIILFNYFVGNIPYLPFP